MSAEVHVASKSDRERWDRFVDTEGGSFFHYFAWSDYYRRAGGRRRFVPLVLEDDTGEIRGIFPLVEDHNALFGSLISLPEGFSCGYLTKRTLEGPARDTAIRAFLEYIDETYSGRYAYFSLQEHLLPPDPARLPSPVLLRNGYEFQGDLVTKIPGDYILPLQRPWRKHVFNRMQKRLRTAIRKAERTGAGVFHDADLACLDQTIALQVEMIQKFGIATTADHYQPYIDAFRDKLRLFVCTLGEEPVSALLCYSTPSIAYWWIGPYGPRSEACGKNLLPLTFAIRNACESGYRYFDMGSTLTASLGAYKKKFGAFSLPIMTYRKVFSKAKMAANRAVLSLGRVVHLCIATLGIGLCRAVELFADTLDVTAGGLSLV